VLRGGLPRSLSAESSEVDNLLRLAGVEQLQIVVSRHQDILSFTTHRVDDASSDAMRLDDCRNFTTRRALSSSE